MSTNQILAAALIAQLGLVAMTWWPRGEPDPAEATDPVPFADDQVTGLEITGRSTDGGPPEPVTLSKRDGAWVIDSLGGYPADPAKVRELLDKLLPLQLSAPIATQATSHAALEVADAASTRRVRVTAGADSRELVLGAAAGQGVHVRLADEDRVYAARGWTAWSIVDTARRYLPPMAVDVPVDEVASWTVTTPGGALALQREEASWTSPALSPEAKLDGDAVNELLSRAVKVRLDDVAGATREPAHGLVDGVRVAWSTRAGSDGGYTIGAVTDGKAFVQVDGSPFVVRVPESSVRPALEATLEGLLASPDPLDVPVPRPDDGLEAP